MENRCYREEHKRIISSWTKEILSRRLRRILDTDENSRGRSYLVRSLYFDTPADDAVWDKLNGVACREKFRLRCYNRDFGFVRLEKKVKEYGKGYKAVARLTEEDGRKIVSGDILFLRDSAEPLLRELYFKTRTGLQRPKALIEYEREAYVYRPGDTRVTLDFNITVALSGKAASGCGPAFFDPATPLYPVDPGKCVLEVKFGRFLPGFISDLIQIDEALGSTNSKYLSGRAVFS